MAQSCVKGARECDGCGRCTTTRADQVGNCEHCSDPIYDYEDYYDIDGELLHEDCLTDWADKFKVKGE